MSIVKNVGISDPVSYRLYKLLEKLGTGSISMDVSRLPNGVYVLKAQSANGTQLGQFVKN